MSIHATSAPHTEQLAKSCESFTYKHKIIISDFCSILITYRSVTSIQTHAIEAFFQRTISLSFLESATFDRMFMLHYAVLRDSIDFTKCSVYFNVFFRYVHYIRLNKDRACVFGKLSCCAAFGTMMLADRSFGLSSSCENIGVWDEDLL